MYGTGLTFSWISVSNSQPDQNDEERLNNTDSSFDSIAEHAQDFIDYFLFVVFGVLGVTFIVIGRYLKISLRQYNEDAEHMFRSKINFSMIVLAVPFMLRSLYILIRKVVNMDK